MPIAVADLRPARPILKFSIGGLSCALPLNDVEEVTAMVGLTPLPGALGHLLGVIDYHGTPCPVVDLRRLLGLPALAIQPDQHLLMVRLGDTSLAVPCDRAEAVLWGSVRPVVADGSSGPLIEGLMHDETGTILVLNSPHLMTSSPVLDGDILRLVPIDPAGATAPETE
jgi:chemotaxis signal transduction protein